MTKPPAKTIGTRHPQHVIDAVEADRDRLNMSLTEWMAMAVDLTLRRKMTQEKAAKYRKPPTREEQRAQRRAEREAAARAAASLTHA